MKDTHHEDHDVVTLILSASSNVKSLLEKAHEHFLWPTKRYPEENKLLKLYSDCTASNAVKPVDFLNSLDLTPKQPDLYAVLLQVDDKPIGICAAHHGEIYIYVKGTHRRRGYGSLLANTLLTAYPNIKLHPMSYESHSYPNGVTNADVKLMKFWESFIL